MAFPVIPEKYLGDFSETKTKETMKNTVVTAAKKVSNTGAGFLDFLIVLTAAFWYYFFTGLAILMGRKIPDQWLKLGTHFGMSGVSSRIRKADFKALQKPSALRNTTKKTFKVVDIDTKRPLKVLKSVK